MKKAIAVLLMLLMCLGLCACTTNVSTDDVSTETSNNTSDNNSPKATVINNDGKTESLTAADLFTLNNGNQVAFNKKYIGAQVTLIAKVKSVHGKTIADGHSMAAYIELEDGWVVEASSSNIVEDLMPGDYVRVTGKIHHVFAGRISLYITNSATTTIQPYNG